MLAFEDLVLVVPAAQIGLDDAAIGLVPCKRSPTMGGGVKRLDLVGVVGEDLIRLTSGEFFSSTLERPR